MRGERPKNILVRSPNWLGDALMTTPILSCLREKLPQARITVLAKPWVSAVFESSPDVDEVILYHHPGLHQGMRGMRTLAQGLKVRGFDTVIHFPHSFESAWISFLSRIPQRIGYATEGRGILLTHRLPMSRVVKEEHQVPFFFHLLEPLGIKERPHPEQHPLRMTVAEEDRLKAEARLQGQGISPEDHLVGLAPGAVYGSAKCWPLERFVSLAEVLIKDRGAKVLLLGTGVDTLSDRGREIFPGSGFYNLLGRTGLGEALALIQKCRLVICNDSGLMHGAASLKVPLVALFGPTNRARTGPWSGINRVIQKTFPCSPCLRKTCPEPETCMAAISVEEVLETVSDLGTGGWF
ncbi:MAG: lipopolysaccharide heptosyltransferase II [Thermodesulfobacteriota bacterium]